MVARLSLLLGWFGILAITILSLVPIELRPHVLAVSQFEHVGAYFATGVALALPFRTRKTLVLVCFSLSLLAALLEVAQLWIPGRDSRLIDWVAGSLGAWAGVAVVLAVFWAMGAARRL
jgi:VanZ family protein